MGSRKESRKGLLADVRHAKERHMDAAMTTFETKLRDSAAKTEACSDACCQATWARTKSLALKTFSTPCAMAC